eukprot:2802751-Amphidinium_carterae.1
MCAHGPPTTTQLAAFRRLGTSVIILLRQNEGRVEVADWERELSESAVSYNGEEVSKAKDITLEQIVPALPPQGVAGSLDLARYCSPDVAEMLYNPTDLIIPEAE